MDSICRNEQVPPIWESARPLLDYQIAKKIWKNKGEIKLNISDILKRKILSRP